MKRHSLLLAAAAALLMQASLVGGTFAQVGKPITGPQPTLPAQKLVIITKDGKRHDFNVEVATTPIEEETGLMFRPSVAPDGGMLFESDLPRKSDMWMKNTIAPLDMVFIKADGTIDSIAENTVPESLAIITSNGPVLATLELAAGTTARLGIVVGDRVEAPFLRKPG
jgi:uncharacterized membrane protein (UPF0127 family)